MKNLFISCHMYSAKAQLEDYFPNCVISVVESNDNKMKMVIREKGDMKLVALLIASIDSDLKAAIHLIYIAEDYRKNNTLCYIEFVMGKVFKSVEYHIIIHGIHEKVSAEKMKRGQIYG